MDYRSIGKNLQKARQDKGLTQEALAGMVNCSPKYISEVERGNKIPALKLLIDMLNALEVSADPIFEDVLTAAPQYKKYKLNERLSAMLNDEVDAMFSLLDAMKDLKRS